jgi:hypothetical protein
MIGSRIRLLRILSTAILRKKAIGSCLILPLFLLGGCENPVSKSGVFLASAEETRVTCPENQFDAVMIREGYGGAAGGFEWYVFISPKGSPVPADYKKTIFQAGTLSGEKLVWADPHLLEIHYDVALIEQFRNMWALDEVRKVGSEGQGDYYVEIRLVPSSAEFSLLTPGGTFKH